jgi:6-phosphofructokinase 1
VRDGEWGMMTALRGDEIVAVPLTEAVAGLKLVPRDLYDRAAAFFG